MKKNINHKSFWAMALATLFLAAGCGDDDNDSPVIAATSPITISSVREVDCAISEPATTINIQANTFSPGSESVFKNAIIKWKNNDAVAHTVTGGTPGAPNGKFDITLAPAQEKCALFADDGPFPYYCRIHPSMTATVQVNEEIE